MSADDTPEDQVETEAGTAELDETQLDSASGGAIGVIAVSHEVIAAPSKSVSADGSVHTGGVNVAFGDGSVRF